MSQLPPRAPVPQPANARPPLHTLAMVPSHLQQSYLPVSCPSSPNTGENKAKNVVSFGPDMIPLFPGPFYNGIYFKDTLLWLTLPYIDCMALHEL